MALTQDENRKQKENLAILKKTLLPPAKFSSSNHRGRACFSHGFKEFGSFETWSIFLAITNNLPKNSRECYELITENTLVKPYLDIEWLKSEFRDLDPDEVKQDVKKLLVEIFQSEFDYNLKKIDILFASCHRPKDDDFKYSFHVIINTTPPVCFSNTKSAIFLANELRKRSRKLKEIHDSYTLNKKYNIKDLDDDENEIQPVKPETFFPEKIVDNGVYGITQRMRMLGHCKNGEFDYPFLPENTGVDIINYIITYIKNGHDDDEHNIILEVPEQKDNSFTSLKNFKNTNWTEHPGMIDEITEKVKIYHPTAFLKTIDARGFLQFNYTDRSEPCFTDKNRLRMHDKIGFFANIKDNKIWVGCHSANCVDPNDSGFKGKDKKIIECVGTVGVNKDLTFEKVHYNNTFEISHDNIKNYLSDSAIGISNLFQEMYLTPKRIKWIDDVKNGTSYFWNGKMWEQDNYMFLDRLLVLTVVNVLRNFQKEYKQNEDAQSENSEEMCTLASNIIKKLCDGLMVQNVLRFVKPLIRDTEFSKIKDIHPHFLSCKNGMVDLYSGELRPAVPDDNITKCIDISYDVSADCRDFELFVRQITSDENGNNNEVYDYLRWFIGYALQGNPNRKMFIILYGEYGFNGKSMLLNTISDVLEYYAVTMDKSVVLEGQKKTAGSHSTELCQLELSRFGILGDTKEDSVIDDGQMKQLTGITDKLSVREIFGKQKELTPTFVPFLNSNHLIKMNLSDKAMYERLIIIPFKLSFVDEPVLSYERKGDNSLVDKFKRNKEGTLKWLIEASVYYNDNQNKHMPQCLKDAKEIYNKQVNNFLEFLDKNFIMDDTTENSKISRTDFIAAYKEYSKENNIKYVKKASEKEFDKLLTIVLVKSKKYYSGLKYINADDEEDDLDM
jgi:P4 family phage/plasmid primase-like protien